MNMPPIRAILPWTSHLLFNAEDHEEHPEDTTEDAETSFLYIPYANRVANAIRSSSDGHWLNNVLNRGDKGTQQSNDTETHSAYVDCMTAQNKKSVILRTVISSLRRYLFEIYPSRVRLNPWKVIIIKVQIARDLSTQGIWNAVRDAAIGRLSSLLSKVE